MLAIKTGIKTVLRTPVKSFLFFVLIGLLTALLSLGLCVYSAVNGYLNECDDFYHSIAELEYLGGDYPDTHVWDNELAAGLSDNADSFDRMLSIEGVTAFDPENAMLGVILGVVRGDNQVYDKNLTVLRIKIMTWDERAKAYLGTIYECPYSEEDNSGKLVFIKSSEEDFIKDEQYAVCGHYIMGSSSYLWLEPESMEVKVGETVQSVGPFELLPEGVIEENSPYQLLAQLMAYHNNGFRVQTVSDIEVLRPWQQGELALSDGRLFSDEEYTEYAKVCIIPSRLVDLADVGVGDSIDMGFLHTDRGIYEGTDTGLGPVTEYLVVGVYPDSVDYPDRIFIPGKLSQTAIKPSTGYVIGQFRLDNRKAAAFMNEAYGLLPMNFKLTLYDEGYSIVSGPYLELERLSIIFLVVCLLVISAVIALFGYLFVLRRRDMAQLQLALGSGRPHVVTGFVAGAFVVAIPGMAVGIPTSLVLQEKVLEMVTQFIEEYDRGDYRYSSIYANTVRVLDFNPVIDSIVFVAAACILIWIMTAFTVLFTCLSMKQRLNTVRKKKKTVKVKGKTSVLSGRLKFTWLSIFRGRMRTASVVLVCAVAGVFLCMLASTADTYRLQLDKINNETVIRGYVTDYFARYQDGLVIRAWNLQNLFDSGLISSVDVSSHEATARVMGVTRKADGTMIELPEFVEPEGFAAETLANQLAHEPAIISTSSLKDSPYFYYDSDPEFTWYEGYDESCLKRNDADLCVLPVSMMEREGIELGDTVRILCVKESRWTKFAEYDLLVAGSYTLQWGHEVMIIPLLRNFPAGVSVEEAFPREYIPEMAIIGNYGFEWNKRALDSTTYKSAIFTLNDTTKLDELRQALSDAGFNETRHKGASRVYAIIDDAEYLSAVQGLERQIRYTDAVYACLYVLTMIIGVVAAFLMLNSRKEEISLMRALGTKAGRVTAVLSVEQLVLAPAGCALGIGIWKLLSGTVNALGLQLCGCFACCWMLGTFIRIISRLIRGGTK